MRWENQPQNYLFKPKAMDQEQMSRILVTKKIYTNSMLLENQPPDIHNNFNMVEVVDPTRTIQITKKIFKSFMQLENLLQDYHRPNNNREAMEVVHDKI